MSSWRRWFATTRHALGLGPKPAYIRAAKDFRGVVDITIADIPDIVRLELPIFREHRKHHPLIVVSWLFPCVPFSRIFSILSTTGKASILHSTRTNAHLAHNLKPADSFLVLGIRWPLRQGMATFTDKFIRGLKPAAKLYEERDAGCPGLVLRVGQRGLKVWEVVISRDGNALG